MGANTIPMHQMYCVIMLPNAQNLVHGCITCMHAHCTSGALVLPNWLLTWPCMHAERLLQKRSQMDGSKRLQLSSSLLPFPIPQHFIEDGMIPTPWF